MKITIRNASIYAATLGCLLLPAAGLSATLEDVDQRLKKLEGDAALNRDEVDDLTSRFKNKMTVTGYADTEYVSTNQAGKESGFRIHHFSMFLKKQISENLRFFSEIEYEDGPYFEPSKATNTTATGPAVPVVSGTPQTVTMSVPDAKTVGSGKIFAEAVNFDYQWRPDTSVRVGRFFTPAGIWSVDHYPPFVSTQDRPQHIRAIFPQLVDGAAISGNHAVGSGFFNYDLFVGNGETTLYDGSSDNNSTKAAGLRVAASLPLAQQFEVGATVYRDKMKLGSADTDLSKKNAKGFHVRIKQSGLGFQAEYAKASYEPTLNPSSTKNYDRKGHYAQLSYDISIWTLGYRYDYYEPKTTKANDVTKINSVFVNYHASKNVVLKWEHHLVNLEDPASKDYYRDLASIVVNLD